MEGRLLDRRQFLSVSGSAALSLASLGITGNIEASESRSRGKLIILMMCGGPSCKETWNPDPPSAPVELRGPLLSIPTRIPGVHFSETFPRLAQKNDQFSLLRGVDSRNSFHDESTAALLKPRGDNLALQVGSRSGGVPYVLISETDAHRYPAYQASNSLSMLYDRERRLYPSPQITSSPHLARRMELLRSIDTAVPSPLSETHDRFRELAFSLLQGGGEFFRAFNLPEKDRERYGNTPLGDGLLLAKRLVEAGAGGVVVKQTPRDLEYDWHNNIGPGMRDETCPPADRAVSAFLEDMRRNRELCTFLMMGEFNRTPRINSSSGRDHFPQNNNMILSGQRIRQGVVHGRSNPRGDTIDGRVDGNTLMNTVLAACGEELRPDLPRVREVLT